MTGAQGPSALVAALFALHPLRVESVAWVCERKDVLSAFFFMLTLWAYGRYAELRSPKSEVRSAGTPSTTHRPSSSLYYWLALLFFTLGLMSKPMLVTLPFVLLLLDYWPLRRFDLSTLKVDGPVVLRLVREKIPFFLLSTVFCVVTFLAQSKVGAVASLARLPFLPRLENAFVSYTGYLAKTVWPVGLANPYPNPWSWSLGQVTVAAVVVGVLCLAAVWYRRRFPFVFLGWFWFVGTLVPVIGLVQAGEQPMADRFTYLPLIGLFVAAAWGWGAWVGRWQSANSCRFVAWALPAVLLTASAVRTRDQVRHWRNSETLFRHAIEVTGRNHIAYNNLGAVLERQGNLTEAIACYQEALHIKPDLAEAHDNLGRVLVSQGRMEEAQAHLLRALELSPKMASAHYHLGNLLHRQGRSEAAVAAYTHALMLNDELSDAHNNLGCLFASEGKLDRAIAHFEKALRSRPAFLDALNNLGSTLTEQGRAAEAISPLTKAVELQPLYAEAQYNLGNACLALNRRREALEAYQTVLALKPAHAWAHYKLGNIFLADHNLAAAIEHYRAALAGNANHAEAHYQLATLLLARQEAEDAIRHYREAVRLKPEWVEALNNLAWLLATHPDARHRDGKRAVELATKAVEVTRGIDADALDTLAAAHAETGQFTKAVEVAQEAIEKAQTAGRTDLVSQLRDRLKRYRSQLPYREAAP
jgi:tetratricopeptide (TPR) repeat protein